MNRRFGVVIPRPETPRAAAEMEKWRQTICRFCGEPVGDARVCFESGTVTHAACYEWAAEEAVANNQEREDA